MVDLFSTALSRWGEFMMRCNVKGRKEMSLDAFWTQSCAGRRKMREVETHLKKLNHNLYKKKRNLAGR